MTEIVNGLLDQGGLGLALAVILILAVPSVSYLIKFLVDAINREAQRADSMRGDLREMANTLNKLASSIDMLRGGLETNRSKTEEIRANQERIADRMERIAERLGDQIQQQLRRQIP